MTSRRVGPRAWWASQGSGCYLDSWLMQGPVAAPAKATATRSQSDSDVDALPSRGALLCFCGLVASWGLAKVAPMFPYGPAGSHVARRLRTDPFHARMAASAGSSGVMPE